MLKRKRYISGMTLVEMMVATLIFLVISTGFYAVLTMGQITWFDTDTRIELQQDLRKVLERVSRELQESGFDKNGVAQVTINDGGGINATDVLRFSIPIICQSGMKLLDESGDVAYWGSPLQWGCTDSACMDADNDCLTVDYKYIEYAIDNNAQLVRRVLDDGLVVVQENIFAQNISDFQLTSSGGGYIITLQVNAHKKSAMNRNLSASSTMNVYLRN